MGDNDTRKARLDVERLRSELQIARAKIETLKTERQHFYDKLQEIRKAQREKKVSVGRFKITPVQPDDDRAAPPSSDERCKRHNHLHCFSCAQDGKLTLSCAPALSGDGETCTKCRGRCNPMDHAGWSPT